MRLSESLNKNIFDSRTGGIINRFMIKRRRNVLFFEDILANYIKECERAGYSEEIENIGEEWMALLAKNIVPKFLIKILFTQMFNNMVNKIWVNIGAVDEGHVIKKDNNINIKTKNEFITRIIGENSFSVGVYKGIIGGLLGSKIECSNKVQNKDYCEYNFKIKNEPLKVETKNKKLYYKLNRLPDIKGFTLKDALKMNIFQLKRDGHVYFREGLMLNGENTVFHLIGNKGILLEGIPIISYNYFKQVIKKSSDIEKINFLKNVLQCTGWGIIRILIKGRNKILVEINHLPFGFQKEKENYSFLISTILGYLWLIDRKLSIKKVEERGYRIRMTYSK